MGILSIAGGENSKNFKRIGIFRTFIPCDSEGEAVMTANVFGDIPHNMPTEVVQTLLRTDDARIERIVSNGHASATDFWYNQPQHEWVIVLKGAARLQFEDGMVEMQVGDFINIPAYKRHRVDWTTPDEPTIWLAVLYEK